MAKRPAVAREIGVQFPAASPAEKPYLRYPNEVAWYLGVEIRTVYNMKNEPPLAGLPVYSFGGFGKYFKADDLKAVFRELL